MTTTTLKFMPYAQAKVKTDDEHIQLISYTTMVIEIDLTTGWVNCTGTYSQTTRKHISAFCKEFGYGLNYQLIKMLVGQHEIYNIYTGEIRDI